jgi:hypothetical protein
MGILRFRLLGGFSFPQFRSATLILRGVLHGEQEQEQEHEHEQEHEQE